MTVMTIMTIKTIQYILLVLFVIIVGVVIFMYKKKEFLSFYPKYTYGTSNCEGKWVIPFGYKPKRTYKGIKWLLSDYPFNPISYYGEGWKKNMEKNVRKNEKWRQ